MRHRLLDSYPLWSPGQYQTDKIPSWMGEEPHSPPLAKEILAVTEGGESPPSGAWPVVGLLREESPFPWEHGLQWGVLREESHPPWEHGLWWGVLREEGHPPFGEWPVMG